jgi:uncharacterized protein (TIGR02996 family)
MAVYFVHRTHYDSTSGKVLTRFDDDNVSDWVRRNWALGRANPERAAELFPFEVYGFTIFSRAHEIDPPPDSDKALAAWLEAEIYAEGEVLCELPHLVTVLSDDDELEFVYYIFDDHYASRYPERVAFLLHDDWRLPAGSADKTFRPKEPVNDDEARGKGKGAIYWTCEAFEDSCNFSDGLGNAIRIKGVRVPDLARYLARHEPSDDWSDYWQLLRAMLFATGTTKDPLEDRFREALLDDPDDKATWAAYSDWLAEHGLPAAGLSVLEQAFRSLAGYPMCQLPNEAWEAVRQGTVREARAALDAAMAAHPPGRTSHDPARTRVHITQNVAQLCLHVGDWGHHRGRLDVYHHWIFFDDRWAAAHKAMANSLLRFTRSAEMLSEDPEDE